MLIVSRNPISRNSNTISSKRWDSDGIDSSSVLNKCSSTFFYDIINIPNDKTSGISKYDIPKFDIIQTIVQESRQQY